MSISTKTKNIKEQERTALQKANDNSACIMSTCQCDLDAECIICDEGRCSECDSDDLWCKHGVVCEECVDEKKYCSVGGKTCGDEE